MTNGGNAIDWLKEKLGLVPTFGPPTKTAYVPPRPVPVPPTNAPLVPAEQPSASLVSTRDHARGRAEGASLVGGR